MSLHILSQGLADHDIVTTRHMLIIHVYYCGLVIIQRLKGFTFKAMIYAIAVHITYIKTLDFNWHTSTLIQPKERSAGNINIEGRAKNDHLSEVHFNFEREKGKSKQTSDLQSTIITFWVVPYTFLSVAISESLVTLLFTFFLISIRLIS